MIHNFLTDLKYSLEERENELFDQFYYRVFPGLKNVEFVEDVHQQKQGMDKILHFKSGYRITVDEKKRRRDYGDILLELWSVWNTKRGWLHTCQCDYIVYALMPAKKVYLLPVLLLKKAWHANASTWTPRFPEVRAQNKNYVTKSIAIPVDTLLQAISQEMRQDL